MGGTTETGASRVREESTEMRYVWGTSRSFLEAMANLASVNPSSCLDINRLILLGFVHSLPTLLDDLKTPTITTAILEVD